MRKTKKLTLASILSALSVVFLYFGAVIEVLDLSFTLLASLIIIFAQIELGRPYQYLMYASVSVLSLILLPNKFSAVAYIFLGGLYPLLRVYLGKIKGRVLRFTIKMLTFWVLFAAVAALSIFVLGIPMGAVWETVAIIVLSNISFIAYDLLIGRVLILYDSKIRWRISRFLK